ncbi:MAG TPA: 2-oxoglutarate dehydrogenase complex dihydrolipoyllysine-residue succinyltransferase [Steroidobacteraceae bacterium]|nr:2-oxoglutarate dehydrogenase complex dihydrolipoyllysine-residue succinyltransferase [Steroidobacteraceae bacterium]
MTDIKVPQLPESITDATLVAWHKKPGDAVKRDENLADLETDKVVLEVPAPANGVLREVKVQTGTVVKAGQLLALFEEGAQALASAATAAKEAASAEELKATGTDAGKEKLSPSVRRLIEENRLDAASIPASGRDGRLTKSDVVDFLGRKSNVAPGASPAASTAAPAAVASAAASAARAPTLAAPVLPAASARGEQRVPMTRLRQRIAQRLIEAQSTQALLTSFNEVDLTAVQELRTRYKDRFEKENGVKLGFMSFFVKASIEALKKFPVVNASVDGSDILYHEFYDIGVAVSTERGLVVPIVRDADLKGFATLEKEIGEYAKKARSGGLAIEDLTGGTFTITNGGVFGSLMSTPIVNAPQSAILGMHKIQERPMVVDGQIAIRPMMYIAITYDHRIIDGREAVQFLVTVKECLEDPGRMLLGI